MAKKLSCDKHKTFNYYCEDCQRLNQGNEVRFKYSLLKKPRKYKKLLVFLVIVVAIVISLVVFWLWPAWFGSISLQSQLYAGKAGGLDYFDFFFLNFWSSNFIFNKTALIGALIGTIIMSIPPERNLLTIIGTRLRFGKPSYLKTLIFWWTAGFVLFYFLGMLLDASSGFSWATYLIENGQIELSPTLIFDAFAVIFNSNNTDFVTIFLYTNLILPIVVFIFSMILIRLILLIVKYIYLRRNDYLVIGIVLIIVGLICGFLFCFMPTFALDGINSIQIFSFIFGFFSFTSLGVAIFVFGKAKFKKDSKNYIIQRTRLRKFIYVIIISIIFTITPLFVSIGPLVNLNNTSVWTEQQWDKKYKREVEWTRACAGLDMFEERPIQNFSQSSISSDALMVSQVRQFDQNYSVQYLAASIGSTFEGLADADIVYINNKEYWVAPKTIRFSEIAGDAVQTNTELYDHVEGFLAMDTFTGELVNVSQKFNISEHYPIFFGESESKRYLQETLGYYQEGSLGAYDSDILLGTEWALGIPKNRFRYEGQPDGTLYGLEGFWKTINIGLFAYAFQSEHQYLIDRNVKDRVRNILLPQLKIDNDPYLVFNMNLGKMYYAVSIYTSINIGAYAQFPILRFLGVCLVDVLNGEMTFYENPSLKTSNDPTYPLWEIYLDKYNWHTIPNWLKGQLRYPEDLFESQLEANYIYHVQNPVSWRRADDFQERPEAGDLFYIESDLGEGIEYVGLDLVKYKGETATLLAGMYVVRHGDHFGEAIFYYTRDTDENLIGPKTARETYGSEATQQISLISGARNGNTLLYPIGGSIYYYIPTYSTAGSLQQLKLAGFVEAFNREVGYGANAQEAYINLNLTGAVTPSNISISHSFDMESSMTYPSDPANFRINLQNLDTNFSAPGLDVKVNLSIYSSITNNVDYNLILPPYLYPLENSTYIDGTNRVTNFTVVDTTLYFGEGLVLNGFLNTNKGNIIIFYRWTLTVNGEILYTSPENLILVFE
ncbi:MAG: hypothetical protein EAX91_16045 [Candidatus Lokiarchaeota archaeon]|nr:hypothetical protein [Candidatus Lokiarchaeota archaeon]